MYENEDAFQDLLQMIIPKYDLTNVSVFLQMIPWLFLVVIFFIPSIAGNLKNSPLLGSIIILKCLFALFLISILKLITINLTRFPDSNFLCNSNTFKSFRTLNTYGKYFINHKSTILKFKKYKILTIRYLY